MSSPVGLLLASRCLWLMNESKSACRVLEKLLTCKEASLPSSTLYQEATVLYGWVMVTSQQAGSKTMDLIGFYWFGLENVVARVTELLVLNTRANRWQYAPK